MIIFSENRLKQVLVVLVMVVFANTIGHDFTWDDSIVITENDRVQKGISGIPDLFVKYNSDYKADKYGYRPIVLTSFAIEYSLFNKNPHLMHLMNVLYFAILCVVIFNVLRKLFYNYSVLVPFLITVLFIVHPLHTEVVANIKSRDEIFAMLFGFLALSRMIDYYTHKQFKQLVYALLLFLGAFLSKESAIIFIPIMILTLFYKTNWRNVKTLVKPILIIIPLIVICLVVVKMYTGSTLGIQASKGAGIYHEAGILGNSFFYTDVFTSKLANAFTLLILYFKNFIWPVHLVYFYGYNQVPVAHWTDMLVILSVIIHLGLLAIAIIYRKKYKEMSYGILFYFISISIYLHVFRTLADTMADRFMFVPSLGLMIVSVFTMAKLFKINVETVSPSLFFNLKKSGKLNETYFKYSFIGIAIVLSLITFNRNKVWKNNETLITHDMPYLENCARAHNYYADILKTKLMSGYNPTIEADMIAHYKKSIQISNESYYSYLGLGTYYCNAKKYNEGLLVLNEWLQKFPNQADPNFYVGQAYYNTNHYDKALFYLQKSLALAPEVLNTYYFLALAQSKCGEYDKAINTITGAKQKFGESTYIYDALGNIYFDKNDMKNSEKYTFEMLKFGANPQQVFGTVIGRYQVKKMDAEASFYYQQALQKGVFKR